MKKKITKPEMKLLKLQKMNVIATSGNTSYEPPVTLQTATYSGGDWYYVAPSTY